MPTITISQTVEKELRRLCEETGRSIDEILLDMLMRDMDPESKARNYVEAANDLIRQARTELGRNNFRQASEKIWGAAALAIKAYVLHKHKKHVYRHVDLWRYKSIVANEFGDWVRDAWLMAYSMHKNFYEGHADREDIERALLAVEKLVKTIYKVVVR